MKKSKLITLIVSLVLILTSFTLLFTFSLPTTFISETVRFNSKYGNKDVQLEGTYYNVKDSEYSVLICPGYSCDREKWRPFANLFVKNGFSTMIFDYSGQAASSGTIGFDNAKTDKIPEQIDDAISVLEEKSSVDDEHIILFGHSMGGRSILRLMHDYYCDQAETNIQKRNIKNIILMSPEVNYNYNAQASLFAGTSDKDEEPWKHFNENDLKGVNVYLYGSTADDIVSDEDIYLQAKTFGYSEALPTSGKFEGSSINSLGSNITVGVTSGVLHSYIMYSPEFASYANEALTKITGKTMVFSPYSMLEIYFGWFIGLAGIFILLISLNMDNQPVIATSNDTKLAPERLPKITNTKQFLLRKLLMWIPGIIIALLICCVCACMPFGSPIMNIPYMCFVAGYGITMLIHFLKGKFKGSEGKLPKISFKCTTKAKTIICGSLISIGIIFFVWYALKTSMYNLIPFNTRIFWLIFATALMTICYYISGIETDMLKENNAKWYIKVLYQLIQWVPLFLFVLFYLIIGSYSGFIGQAQNMVLFYLLCIPLGNFVKKFTGNRLYGAIITAFIFQGLMITSAAIISFF